MLKVSTTFQSVGGNIFEMYGCSHGLFGQKFT